MRSRKIDFEDFTTPLVHGAREGQYYQNNFPGWRNLVAMAGAWKLLRGHTPNTAEMSMLKNNIHATHPDFFRGVLLFARERNARAIISPYELACALNSLFPGRFLGWDGEMSCYLKWTANRLLRVRPGVYPVMAQGFLGKKTPGGEIPEMELFDKEAHVRWLAGRCLAIRPARTVCGEGLG